MSRLASFDGENMVDIDLSTEMEDSYSSYALSVVTARALPDIRDGLKPVHRRILYAMNEDGLRPGTAYRKSANAVGQVMARYHPHGDSAIYDTLVRMSQWWSLRVPMVDGHGNFGNMDDGPAAMRYTEARLHKAAMEMVADIDENTVDMAENFDGTRQEPVVLPAGIPNLLVNGTSGIAVGMATSIPPHNLGEVVAALKHLLVHPEASVADLMEHVPGPDFPTGGKLMGAGGLQKAYETGDGKFRLRATTSIEQVSERRRGIVITELPYTIGPERVIETVKKLVREEKLAGIANIVDLSDRKHGLRLVIEVKNNYQPEALRDQLFSLTPLETTVSFNAVALVDGIPRRVTLLDMCQAYLDHRIEVLQRRSRYRLDKANARLHIVDGLLIALASIDEVVAVIKASKSTDVAHASLRKKFELSDVQAQHILEMPLRRLTGLEVDKLKQEQADLKATIEDLTDLLADEARQKTVVGEQLDTVADRFADDRRTVLTSKEATKVGDVDAKMPDTACHVVLTATGKIGWYASDHSDRRTKPTKDDVIVHVAETSTHQKVLLVTDRGRGHYQPVGELPNWGAKVDPVDVDSLVDLEPGETIVGVIDPVKVGTMAFATRNGKVKRVEADKLSTRNPTDVMGVDDDDALIGVADGAEGRDFVLAASNGKLLRTSGDDVRPKGRGAGGVAGMKLKDDAQVVMFGTCVSEDEDGSSGDEVVYLITDGGGIKPTAISEFATKGRGGQGVGAINFVKDDNEVIGGMVHDGWGTPLCLSTSNRPKKVKTTLRKRAASAFRIGTTAQVLGVTNVNV